MRITGKIIGEILGSWFLIGLVVAATTSNIGWNTFKSKDGFAYSLTAVTLWPVPAGTGLCRSAKDHSGIHCGGFVKPSNIPDLPYKVVPTSATPRTPAPSATKTK